MEVVHVHDITSCVQGYHIYKEMWTAVIGERFSCMRKLANTRNRYAVALLKNGTIVENEGSQ